jgi:hypothetical protein
MSKVKTKPDLSNDKNNEQLDEWFGLLIQGIQTDHFLLKENIASEDTKNFYQAAMSGNELSMATQVRATSSRFFITKLVFDYLKEISTFKKIPLKLALGLSDSKIMVWSEINDDDEATEDALLLAEARVNNKYQSNGFFINSTIIEKSDNLKIPPHYQNISIPTLKN